MRIKTKLSLGTGFLFFVILLFGILSLASIYRLKNDAGQILKNNYETLVYCNSMQEALDKISTDSSYKNVFEQNLRKQESNITELGEKEATTRLRKSFNVIKKMLPGDSVKRAIRSDLHEIIELNQAAIFRKNTMAKNTAENANNWLLVIFSVLILVTFTMAVNFPSVISKPITKLNDGIRSIVNKNYNKRIYLTRKDEFGELADAFNTMAEKLDEYEHSSLAKLTFEKSRIETIINKMNDGIIGLDEKQHILFLNEVAQQLLGLKEADIVDKYAVDIALSNDLMRKLLQDRSSDKDLKIFNGTKESYFQVEALAVTHEKKTIGEVIILRNITSFHEADEARNNFIATISHELKTPVAAIKSNVRLLADERVGVINSQQRELIDNINIDVERLMGISNELVSRRR